MKIEISIIYGSTRPARLGIRFARYLKREIENNNIKAHLIDPMEYKIPMLEKRFVEYNDNDVSKNLVNLHRRLKSSDAYIIVSAEYNHFPPPALINIINHFSSEYNRKPSAVCTYSSGDLAGIRAQNPMRVMMSQLGCPPIKFGMFQPNITKFFNNDGKPYDNDDAKKRFDLFFNELLWYAKTLKSKRESN